MNLCKDAVNVYNCMKLLPVYRLTIKVERFREYNFYSSDLINKTLKRILNYII